MKFIDKFYILLLAVGAAWMVSSCAKQKEPEPMIRIPPPEFLEFEEEDLDDLPEDTGDEELE